MRWIIEPMTTKNVAKFTTYMKGNHSFIHATYYRWGEAFVQSDSKPVLTEYNEESGINIQSIDYNIEYELHECYYSRIMELSRWIPKHIKTSLRDKLFVEYYEIDELVDDGWCYCKHDIVFRGTLQIEVELRKGCRD